MTRAPLFHPAVLAFAASLAGALELRAQVSVMNVRNLEFGSVLPGVPTAIPPTDFARSGQFEIRGPANCPIEVSFILPSSLTGPGGAAMPLSFGPASAGYAPTGSISGQVLFDPSLPFPTTLSSSGTGTGFLGGALAPSATQAPGGYSGPVIITVAPTCA